MQITDEITDIVFRNEDNGYSVIRLKQSNQTAFGVFAYLAVGQEIQMTGEYVKNAKYGQQFRVQSYEIVPPNSPRKIQQFIGSGLLEGVGPATAARIVAEFGKDTLKVLETRPHELEKVRGISLRKAKIIGEKYGQIKEMQAAVMFLQKFEISLNMAMKIYKYYGQRTIEKVQSNPYALVETIEGIGFITADKMAKAIGHAYSGAFRVRAGIVYALKQKSEQDGHTFLPHEQLLIDTCKLLEIKKENLTPVFYSVIYDLCLDKYLTVVNTDDERGYMLTRFFVAERGVATNLNKLALEYEGESTADFEKLLAHYEEINNIKLHEKQIEAIRVAVTRGICVITGGPGTGKTTIVRAILYINDAQGLSTKLLAPTGRAAKRMEETTGKEASTIHRALDIQYGDKPASGFNYDESEGLMADVIIVDEVSMCDIILTNHLLKKVLPGTRVIFVGDIDQLPSVGAGNVLSDIISSNVIPVVRLTEIYRQSEASQIVISAHQINRGEMPDLTNRSNDFFYVAASNPADIKQKVVGLVTTRIPAHLGLTSSKIQVLCPMKVGEAGMNSLNTALQSELNPSVLGRAEYEYGQVTFRVGDRVMQTQNNYNQEWVRPGPPSEDGSGVFNGDIGTVTDINRQNGEIAVEMEDGRVTTYMRTDLAHLVLAYAITVHKSQGSEFDVAIIPVTSGAYMILTRNLLYTAVTRAKKMVVLVGSADNIEKMVNNTYTKRRYTMLSKFLIDTQESIQQLHSLPDSGAGRD
ncbi:MAG: ATP-dependent RecD-like DNA helicase [Firmicutes bacterium]|nr:ATP-dependent RecD-like DNA helicase [Bacillota bacterium]